MKYLALLIALIPSAVLANDLQIEAEAESAAVFAYDIVASGNLGVDLHSVDVEKMPAPEVKPIPYADAHKLYKDKRVPMVVMVTSQTCVYCPAVKGKLIELQKKGDFGDASLVIVDYGEDRRTARSVMDGRRYFPAMTVYYYVDGEPKQSQPRKPEQVEGILKQSNRLEPPKTTPVPEEKQVSVKASATYCRTCR